ncbi:hypothetical protein J3R74_000861 [Puniceicoccus vermicola]
MKEGIAKWKLGWNVFLRALLLYLLIAVFSVLLIPAKGLWEWTASWPFWARIPMLLVCLTFALYIFPMMFYWTARITGYLQGSDRDEFSRIRLVEREKNEYGEKDPWEE